MVSGNCSPGTWETWVWVSLLIQNLKLRYWAIQAAWSGSAFSDRRWLMAVCICDSACLHPECPGVACCPWQMGATRNHRCSRQEPGDLYLRPILSAFQQSLWVCWHLSKASRVDLEAVCLWAMEPLRCCCSGTRGQPQQGRAGCRAVALLAAGPVANFWCISLKKSHG